MGLIRGFSLAAVLTTAIGVPISAADAHGIWFAQRANQVALVYGIGADDLDTVRRFPQFEDVIGYDADYQPIKAEARIAGPIVLVDSDSQPTLLTAVMQNGIWSKVGDGEFEKKTLEEMPNATISEKTVKYGVSIQGPLTKEIPAIPKHALQIIPAGPIPTLLGEPLKYKVLFMGKPLAGARMINDMINDPDAKEQRTAADGTITMPVRNQGLNVIRAVHEGPSDAPTKYRTIEHTATLAFTLAHAPE